jgi:dihydrofolate reductase
MTRPPFIAIAAVDDRLGIARNGTLPWHVPSDLKRFRRLTVGDGRNAIVMGRLTWQSPEVGARPLPRRLNVVLARTELATQGAILAHTWREVIEATRDCENVWIAGGAGVYASAFEEGLVDAIELTRIGGDFGCDLFFPAIPESFHMIHSEDRLDGTIAVRDERWQR